MKWCNISGLQSDLTKLDMYPFHYRITGPQDGENAGLKRFYLFVFIKDSGCISKYRAIFPCLHRSVFREYANCLCIQHTLQWHFSKIEERIRLQWKETQCYLSDFWVVEPWIVPVLAKVKVNLVILHKIRLECLAVLLYFFFCASCTVHSHHSCWFWNRENEPVKLEHKIMPLLMVLIR